MKETQGFKDMKVIKTILDLKDERIRDPRDSMILFGASLEVLRDLREKTQEIHERLDDFDGRMENIDKPTKETEDIEIDSDLVKKFTEKIDDLDEEHKNLLKSKLLEQKEKQEKKEKLNTKTEMQEEMEEKFKSPGEKRKEKIKEMLQKYDKVNPTKLSSLIGLSRTRCNEYLKEMENEGQTESFREGRKVFYKLRQ